MENVSLNIKENYKEKLVEKYKKLFESQIMFRGKDYYVDNKVKNVFKDNNRYISTVKGNYDYDVEVIIQDGDIKLSCSCPCIDNCKHEYATLLAIDNNEYTEIELLPVPNEDKINIQKLINDIPENKLKEYIISIFNDDEEIYLDNIIDDFSNYLPEKSKEYIYNTLFNDFQINKITSKQSEFINLAKKSVENKNYSYAFTIISSIIDSFKESNYNDKCEIITNEYIKLGTLIRISYRKGDDTLKNNIDKWINNIESKEYYNDIYLEDMILSIKL